MYLSIFSEFAEIKPATYIFLLALVTLGVLLLLMRSKKWSVRALTFGALCIAISFILSYLKFYSFPQGGTVTPGSMFPLMLYSYAFGPVAGFSAGVLYGLLQLFQDFYVTHPLSLIMDYVLAFGMLGLASLPKKNLTLAVLLAGFGRWFWHFLSGFLFFAEYAWEGWNPILYSAVYNMLYIGPDLIICVIISLIPRIRKLGADLRENHSSRV